MSARWYSPATGSFTSNDTLGGSPLPSTVDGSPYAYADGNPLTDADPTGHFLCVECIEQGLELGGSTAGEAGAETGPWDIAIAAGGALVGGALAWLFGSQSSGSRASSNSSSGEPRCVGLSLACDGAPVNYPAYSWGAPDYGSPARYRSAALAIPTTATPPTVITAGTATPRSPRRPRRHHRRTVTPGQTRPATRRPRRTRCGRPRTSPVRSTSTPARLACCAGQTRSSKRYRRTPSRSAAPAPVPPSTAIIGRCQQRHRQPADPDRGSSARPAPSPRYRRRPPAGTRPMWAHRQERPPQREAAPEQAAAARGFP